MADYKRLVSYVYSYEYGKKTSNVGFAKVDCRNGICKVIINFKLKYVPVLHPLKVYFFKRSDHLLTGVLMGIGTISGSNYAFRDITNSINIKGSGFGVEEMSGFYIGDEVNTNIIYACEWDNRPIMVDQFVAYNKLKHNGIKQQPIQNMQKNEKLEVDDKVISILNDYINENNAVENSTIVIDSLENMSTEEELKKEKIFVHEDKYDHENKTIEINNVKNENIWEQLYNKHTKVIGLKKFKTIECIKIKPQDLACLPNKYWILGNNSFLLHGYYIYRYLLFANISNQKDNQIYKLGVPGMFHQNERLMASMFGFNEFLEADQENNGKDIFGYWCMDIQIP